MGKLLNVGGNSFKQNKINVGFQNGYLNYLQGDKNSYIFVEGWNGYRANAGDVAGTIPSDAPKIEVGLLGCPSVVGESMIFGAPDDEFRNLAPCMYTVNNLFKIFTQGKGASFIGGKDIVNHDDDVLHTITYGSVKSYIDGVEVVDNSDMSNQYRLGAYNHAGILIFGGYYNGGVKLSSARIQFVKMYNGDTLVHDLRAYLKDGVPCMKDEVGGEYYYNQGVGTFQLGELIE